MTTADAIPVIVVIMRHMRFLPFCYDQQQPDKDLTEEVRGLFPRVAQKIEISVLGAQVQVVRGASRWTGGLGRESACVSDERHAASNNEPAIPVSIFPILPLLNSQTVLRLSLLRTHRFHLHHQLLREHA